jgi:hypothetical protein
VIFEVVTAASTKFIFVFWDVLPCKIIIDRRFRGTCDRPDDGGSTYLWNVGRQLFYTAVHPGRQIWTSSKGLRSLFLCAIVLRSPPASHVSTSYGQWSSQLFCVHYTFSWDSRDMSWCVITPRANRSQGRTVMEDRSRICPRSTWHVKPLIPWLLWLAATFCPRHITSQITTSATH